MVYIDLAMGQNRHRIRMVPQQKFPVVIWDAFFPQTSPNDSINNSNNSSFDPSPYGISILIS